MLAPLLFNMYVVDLPLTCRKFMYADDVAFAVQHSNMRNLEITFYNDLDKLFNYFKRWQLIPGITKTKTPQR